MEVLMGCCRRLLYLSLQLTAFALGGGPQHSAQLHRALLHLVARPHGSRARHMSWFLCSLLIASAQGFLAPHSTLPSLSRAAALPDALEGLRFGAPAAARDLAALDGASSLLLADGENYATYAVATLFAAAIAFYAVIIFMTPKTPSKWD